MQQTRVKGLVAALVAFFVALIGITTVPTTAQAVEANEVAVTFTPDPSVPSNEYNLWVWNPGGDGVSRPFTGTDANGNLTAAITPPSASATVNVIVRRSTADNDWAWQTPDLTEIPVPSTVTIDYRNPTDFIVSAPGSSPNSEAPTSVDITVHYVRYDENYTGWNVWTWLPNEDGRQEDFTDENGDHVVTFTQTNEAGIDSVGLIIRQSIDGNDWADKNTPDDLYISSFPDGKAEIWIVQGNSTIFYSGDNLPAEPEIGPCQDLHSAEFNEQYFYDGELGAIYSPESTTFRLWAPTATLVEFVNYSTAGTVTTMNAGEKGTWEITLDGDQALTEYRYRLTFPDGSITESNDPYARAVTANATRTVVVDPRIGDAGARMEAFPSPLDAVIYESHVRDLTIAPDNGIEHKGKFLGLTESGTTTDAGNPSGLDYIKSLGVTHVQFLPIYDFGSVDETGNLDYNAQYNWGYDPVNYNVPEGSYATDALDPTSRITELKTMIKTLHDNDLRVIMDVVYNHVYNTALSPLEMTVPGYYFRMTDNCTFQNGTGVGNETASEQLMMQKYIVDSITYWAKNYNIDGFRFDLMGIHDVDTMNKIRAALNEIDPSIIMIGEGWDMGNHPSGVTPSNYHNASLMPGIAHFNDDFRDVMKGSTFDATAPGFVSGDSNPELATRLFTNIAGAHGVRDFASPDQSVIYNEAHDNFTLFDKLTNTLPNASIDELARRHTLATSVQFLSNGVVFLHAGQEMLRTKNGDENSYRSPDSVNAIDYDRQAAFADEVAYMRDLNAFRQANTWVRMNSYDAINAAYTQLTAESYHLSYKVANAYPGHDAYVLVNSDTNVWTTNDISAGDYEVLIRDGQVLDVPERVTIDGATDVAALSVLVIRQAPGKEPEQPTGPSTAVPDASTDAPDSASSAGNQAQPTPQPPAEVLAKTGASASSFAVLALLLVVAGMIIRRRSA